MSLYKIFARSRSCMSSQNVPSMLPPWIPMTLKELHGKWFPSWFELFDRRHQILIVSHHEIKSDPMSAMRRVHEFLQVPFPYDHTDETNITNGGCVLCCGDSSSRQCYESIGHRPAQLFHARIGARMVSNQPGAILSFFARPSRSTDGTTTISQI
jgi:hypothetical protein